MLQSEISSVLAIYLKQLNNISKEGKYTIHKHWDLPVFSTLHLNYLAAQQPWQL